MEKISELLQVQRQIKACRACAKMCGKPVHGPALDVSIVLVGQAPGTHEAERGRPFAHTAGKSLFRWFQNHLNVSEDWFRNSVYIASVARCFPGKALSGKGDREPDASEIAECRRHLRKEISILQPKLVIAVGRVAIAEVLGPAIFSKGHGLKDVVGRKIRADFHGQAVDVFCLPHPSGISVWPLKEPGKSLLKKAMIELGRHPAWRETASAPQFNIEKS